jgi:hypothetical protein
VIGIAELIRLLLRRESPQGIESKDRGIRNPRRVNVNEDWYYASGVTLLVPRSTVTSTGTVSGAIGGTGIIGPSGVTVWTLVNNGSVSAASGVVLNGAGTVINAGSVAGTSHYGIWLKAGGYVSNAASGVISAGTASGFGVYVKAGGAGTVVNAGEITAFDGIILKSPGTVINSGTIGAALGEGIGSYGGGNVSNAASGVISAKYSGIVLAGGSAASVVNAGNVTSAKYAGVYLSDTGDMLTNIASGTIKGVIGVLLNAAGTLINNGQIVASGSSVPGVALTAGGTVDNAGTISTSSGTAVAFGGVSADRLIDHPGAVFTGAVVASASAASSTVELVFAPAAGTIFGIGTRFGGFGSVVVDSAASWTLTGVNKVAGAITNFGTLTDLGTLITNRTVAGAGTIVIDGGDSFLTLGGVGAAENVSFAAASGTLGIAAPSVFAATVLGLPVSDTFDFTTIANSASLAVGLDSGDHLTITGGGTLLASIRLDGSRDFGGLAFGHVSDGSGGTDVVLAPPPLIGNTVPGQQTTDESAIDPFSGVTITDPTPSPTETMTIMLSDPANGVLSNLAGGTFNSGTYTVSGSTGAVTTAVEGLVFTPTAHQMAPGSSVTTSFTIMATDAVGVSSTDSTTTVIATAVNDPPAIAGAVAGQAMNDNGTGAPFSAVTINDPDLNAAETVTITLTANGLASDANGMLSAAGLAVTGTGTYTLAAGSPAAAMAALEALVFTPTIREVAVGNTVTTGMTLSVSDGIVLSPVTDTTTSVIATAVGSAIVTSFTIASAADLTADLLEINAGGVDASPGAAYTFNFVCAFAIASTQSIDLPGGGSVTFTGGNATTGGGYEIAVGTLVAGDANAIGSGAITVDAGGFLNINSFNQTIGDLSGAGSIALDGATLTEGTANTTTFSGVISGTGALTRQGSRELTLSAPPSAAASRSAPGPWP